MNAGQAVEIPLFLASFVLTIIASFSVRDSLGEYITKVRKTPTFLSGVMTIFFGPIYLQYHMNRVRSFQRNAALECAITREC
jgi:diphthamide synthase (EF-2-diphthine--ammonia ligase)